MEKPDVKILIVDDVNTIRIHLKEILISAGFRKIKTLANAQEAIELLDQEEMHLILADWHMSPVDGLELLKYVRATPKTKNTPFIMVTAEATRDLVMTAIILGVDDYIVKPLSTLQVEKIVNVLRKKKVLL
jgi:two-component system, chemotaxis family, chemotaxis protein CheY